MKYLLIIFSLCFLQNIFAVSDSTVCKKLNTSLSKIKEYFIKGDFENRDKQMQLADSLVSFCSKRKSINELIKYKVISAKDKGDFDLAHELLKGFKYDKICKNNNDSLNKSAFFSLKSIVYIDEEKNNEAISNIEKSLSFLNKDKNKKEYIFKNYNRAHLLKTFGNDSLIIKIYKENIRLSKELDPLFKIINYQALGVAYSSLNQFDSCSKYYKKCIDFYKKTNNLRPIHYVNLIWFEAKLKQAVLINKNTITKKDIKEIEIANKEFNATKQVQLEINTLSCLGNYYVTLTKLSDKGVSYLKKAYKLAAQNNYKEELAFTSKLIIESKLKNLDSDTNNYAQTYFEALDHKFNTNNTKEIIQFQEKINLKEKEEQLLISENNATKSKLEAANNRAYLIYSILGFLLVLLIGIIIYIKRQNSNKQKVEELKKKALQLQMNPHFFFNVLNSINSFIVKNDKQTAQQYLGKFSKLMRLTLENAQADLIPIEKEIDLVENYMALEQLRTKNFEYKVEVDEELKTCKIPPLMIQPFVENSIVHAFRGINQKGEIKIKISKNKGLVNVNISDNGIGIDKTVSNINPGKTSLALKITRERLNSMFKHKEEVVFDTLNKSNTDFPGTLVSFRIPVLT